MAKNKKDKSNVIDLEKVRSGAKRKSKKPFKANAVNISIISDLDTFEPIDVVTGEVEYSEDDVRFQDKEDLHEEIVIRALYTVLNNLCNNYRAEDGSHYFLPEIEFHEAGECGIADEDEKEEGEKVEVPYDKNLN